MRQRIKNPRIGSFEASRSVFWIVRKSDTESENSLSSDGNETAPCLDPRPIVHFFDTDTHKIVWNFDTFP